MADTHLDIDKVGAGWTQLMKERSIQFSFPDMTLISQPAWFRRLLDFIVHHAHWFRVGSEVVLVIAGLVALFFLVRFALRHDWSGADQIAAPRTLSPWQPSAERARLLLRDADALAQQGRFDEAAHLLLLVAIQEIGERRPGLVMPALTSREIGALPELSPRARAVFGTIAQVVERCLFGARPLAAQDFAQCRQAFEQFTVPDAWARAA